MIYQFLLFHQLSPQQLSVTQDLTGLMKTCRASFIRQGSVVTTSKLQKQVARTLKSTGEHVSEEEIQEDSGFVVDIRLVDHRAVIEVDGPSHFL